jgi:hypothetical protein
MKSRVTICFYLWTTDSQTKSFIRDLAIPNGLFGLGEHDIEKLKKGLNDGYLLLKRVPKGAYAFAIKPGTLWASLRVDNPDDLEAKNTTHARDK